MRADDRDDSGEEFDISRAHCAKDMHDEHQPESKRAPNHAYAHTAPAIENGVYCQTTYQRRQHQTIRDAAIAHVVISDNGCEQDEQRKIGDELVGHCDRSPSEVMKAKVG